MGTEPKPSQREANWPEAGSHAATLTSLAMLKVNLDKNNLDYLDYLRPFIVDALGKTSDQPISDALVQQLLLESFGLWIPAKAVQTVLVRLVKSGVLRREHGTYHPTSKGSNPAFAASRKEAQRHIDGVVASFIAFSKQTVTPVHNEEEAISALIGFLSEFEIDCLRAYIWGTALPEVRAGTEQLVSVSLFVRQLAERDRSGFASFMVLVQGHMLANALLCPDLAKLPRTFSRVIFYLDTPLVVRLLGLEGPARQAAADEALSLVRTLGGTVGMFAHTREELAKVIRGAADHVDMPGARGAIVLEARRAGRTKSDLLLIAEGLDDELQARDLRVMRTPRYSPFQFEIDELTFEEYLADEVSYYNPRAKEYDINSVRSIYMLRSGQSPTSLEKAIAVLVTCNSGFARAAFKYGRDIEETRAVSSVVTDFSVANVAWLKAPLKAPNLPAREVLAYCYAALQPSEALWSAMLAEADKLEQKKDITPRQHQLLRSSLRTRDELVDLTLGEVDELTSETVSQIVERVEEEIRQDEHEKLLAEAIEHQATKGELDTVVRTLKRTEDRVRWFATRLAVACVVFVDAAILACIVAAALFGFLADASALRWMFRGVAILLTIAGALFGFGNLVFGVSLIAAHRRTRVWLERKFALLLRRGLLLSADKE